MQNIKRKHHLEPLSGALKTAGGTFEFQTFTSKYRVIFLKPLNLFVRPVSGTFMWNLLTLMWNLDPKPSCGTFMQKSLCEAFIRNLHDKPFCETFMWNLYVKLWWLLRVEPLSLRGTRHSALMHFVRLHYTREHETLNPDTKINGELVSQSVSQSVSYLVIVRYT